MQLGKLCNNNCVSVLAWMSKCGWYVCYKKYVSLCACVCVCIIEREKLNCKSKIQLLCEPVLPASNGENLSPKAIF